MNGCLGKTSRAFWGQVVAWSINAGASQNLETRMLVGERPKARIVVDARDDERTVSSMACN